MVGQSRWALGISCVVGLGSALRVFLVSPDLVPTHYGIGGVPDRWGSRAEVLVVHGCVIGLSTLFFFAVPALIRRAPASMINLPNKEHWLSPEHRGATTARFAQWAAVVGTGLNALMVTLQLLLSPHQGVLKAQTSQLLSFVTLGFVLFTLGSCVWLALSFRAPARAE